MMRVSHINANSMRRNAGRLAAILYALKPVAESDQSRLIGKWQGSQQHTLNDGKDSGGGPDAKARVRIAVSANPGDLRS